MPSETLCPPGYRLCEVELYDGLSDSYATYRVHMPDILHTYAERADWVRANIEEASYALVMISYVIVAACQKHIYPCHCG